ncbi:hypothetical protein H6P81_005388 [Aristolochia fimbriata]|uniref:Uncharacterized protein n=1 Tax=Aristolochia fimbriata TaxID=158543 RepID=A0AAV7EVQ5_ARIFI|nr:hypothetical protein H6P81_005388 [Aristolochia fimbriata]
MANVQITSTESIPPSSSTPERLRTYKLSMVDMHIPPFYLPLLLYYSPRNYGSKAPNGANSHQLKTSLSEALTHFFPLAGRMKEESSIDCNDEGVEYFEAQVSCQLSEFLELPNMAEFLYELLPCKQLNSKSGAEVLLAIQVNHFQCGGIAIGVSLYHMVADMATMANFIHNWATTARGTDPLPGPCFNSASLFPATRGVDKIIVPTVTEELSTKRFVFTESSITTLRAKSSSYSRMGRPSRVEAVTALVWRCFIRATWKEGRSRALACQHAVNFRSRMDPPQPDNSFGNLLLLVATSGVAEKDLDQVCLEEQLREAFKQIDSDYIKDLQGPNGHVKILESTMTLAEKFPDMDVDFFAFSSWSRFPFYEIDFGWGKPAWVSTAPLVKNAVVLLDRKWGDGLEAWVNLEEEYMARLVQDEELLSFVSNPATV